MAIKEDGSCGCNNCCSEIIDDSGSCCGYDTNITPCKKNTLISLGVILIVICVINLCLNWDVISFSFYYTGVFILIDSIPNVIGIIAGSFCFLCHKMGYAVATLVLTGIISLFGILAVAELGLIINYDCDMMNGDPFCKVVAAHFSFTFLRLILSLIILVFVCILLCSKKETMASQDSNKAVNNL